MEVSLEDHRSEDYTPPAYRAYSGEGAALGKATPAHAAAVVKPTTSGAGAVPALDAALPSTTLQVKLADGRREKIQMNLSNTIAQLQARVAAMGGSGGRAFVLMAGFPPKPLDVGVATLEAAGLKNASITQVAQ